MTSDDVTQDMYLTIQECDNPGHTNLEDAIIEYWTSFGVKSVARLCEEEPDLCSKMKNANAQVRILFS